MADDLPEDRVNPEFYRLFLKKQALLLFKKNQPDFYAGYVSARVVVNRGGHKTGTQPAPAPATATAWK
jgi:hypothetical protein